MIYIFKTRWYYLLSQHFLKFSRIACHPSICISWSWISSASKVSVTVTQPHDPSSTKLTSTTRPASTKSVSLSYDPMTYEKCSIWRTWVYCPIRSNQKLPSRASMRVVNVSPTLGSDHFAHGQCRVASSANARLTT